MDKILILSDVSDYISRSNANDLHCIQQHLIDKINNIYDQNLKELTILLADDLLCQMYGEKWFQFLIEEKVLYSCIGGETFFDRLETFLDSQNREMIFFYCLAIKFGFQGKYNGFPLQIYNKCLQVLNLNYYSNFGHTNNIQKNYNARKQDSSYFISIFIICLLGIYIVWNGMEMIALYLLRHHIFEIGEALCF